MIFIRDKVNFCIDIYMISSQGPVGLHMLHHGSEKSANRVIEFTKDL